MRIGRYDFVSESGKMGSNLNAGRHIKAGVNATGTICGIRIRAVNGEI